MLAEQITHLRTRAGMTQRQLAKELHVGLSAIGMYEQGRRTPSVEILIQMSNLFGVSLDYLITGKEFSAPTTESPNATTQPCPCRACCPCCGKFQLLKITHCCAKEICEESN